MGINDVILTTIELSKTNLEFLVSASQDRGLTPSELIAELIDKFARQDAKSEPWEELLAGFDGVLSEMRQLLAEDGLKRFAADQQKEVRGAT